MSYLFRSNIKNAPFDTMRTFISQKLFAFMRIIQRRDKMSIMQEGNKIGEGNEGDGVIAVSINDIVCDNSEYKNENI